MTARTAAACCTDNGLIRHAERALKVTVTDDRAALPHPGDRGADQPPLGRDQIRARQLPPNYGETLLGSLLYLFDNGNDHIYGGPGNDDLDGQNGDDTLIDTSGTDTMSGSVGSDTINVQDGAGGDSANGGLGAGSCTTDTGDTRISC